MKTKDGLFIELTEQHDCGYWNCIVTMLDGTELDCCECFAGNDGNDFLRETLRDMSGPTPREL